MKQKELTDYLGTPIYKKNEKGNEGVFDRIIIPIQILQDGSALALIKQIDNKQIPLEHSYYVEHIEKGSYEDFIPLLNAAKEIDASISIQCGQNMVSIDKIKEEIRIGLRLYDQYVLNKLFRVL